MAGSLAESADEDENKKFLISRFPDSKGIERCQ
jgi:hypothetical protein